MNGWDREVDLLVVGTGAAGLSAAITGADSGLETLVVESTELWGGTTMRSGGGLWMPTNPLMNGIGVLDSVADALTYMEEAIGDAGPASSPERRLAFVHAVPAVFGLLDRLGMRWAAAKDYPDYYPDRQGGRVGRSIEPVPFDAKRLGDWLKSSRYKVGLPVPLKNDDVWLLARAWSTPSGFVRGARFVFRTLGGLATGKKLYGLGSSLSMNLMHIVRKQGTEVLPSSPLSDLIVEDGKVVGAVITTPKGEERIRVRAGVVLAAGGFAQNTQWRQKYHGVPGYSSAAPEADGSAQFMLSERSMPFSIIVDQTGTQYTNESQSYIDFGHDLLAPNKKVGALPSWLILDHRHRQRYLSSSLLMHGKQKREHGIVVTASTLDELAAKMTIDPAALRDTVERFNGFARSGVDTDFGRGRTVYDNYYGDPRVKPNPNLGTIEKGPFTALQIVPGDLGTKGGLLTDERACILNEAGVAIAGLYAAGNNTASVMGHTYPGPGSTISPAVIFGYLGARHAAEQSHLSSATATYETENTLP